MKLHEAIEFVIRQKGKAVSGKEIADVINVDKLYEREDKTPLQTNHIYARISNYPNLFVITNDHKIDIRSNSVNQYRRLISQLKEKLKSYDNRNADLIIATLLFLARTKAVFPDYINESSNYFDFNKYSNSNIVEFNPTKKKYTTSFELSSEDINLINSIFSHFSSGAISELINIIKFYDFDLDSCSHEQFGSFFNSLINAADYIRGALGDFATPINVSKIIAELATINENDEIFDPFAGNASFFSCIKSKIQSNFKIYLNDIDKYSVWLGKMNLVVNNIHNFQYSNVNSLAEEIIRFDQIKKYDWVITHPPFGERLSKSDQRTLSNIFGLFGPSSKTGLIYLELCLNHLKENGRALIIVPEAFLFVEDKGHLNARKYLIESGFLKSVISLPQGVFAPYTNAKASILVIDKSLVNKNVEFYDVSESDLLKGGEGIINEIKKLNKNYVVVRKENIVNNRFSLLSNRYSNSEIVHFSGNAKRLRDLVSDYFSGNQFKQSMLNRSNGIPYVSIKDLSDEKQFPHLYPEKIDLFVNEFIYKGQIGRKIPKNSILIAKVGNKLKPTLNVSDLPAFVSNNVLVLFPNAQLVSPTYLLSQFFEPYVLRQVERIRGGAAQPFVRVDDLLNIYINTPAPNEQRETENSFVLSQMQNLPAKDLVDITESNEEIDLAHAIEHEFKNLNNPLKADIGNLKDFIDAKINSKQPIKWDDKITLRQEARKIHDVFSNIENLMQEMGTLIGDIVTVVNLDKESKTPVLFSAYFEKVIEQFRHQFQNVIIKIESDKKKLGKLLVNIDEKLFNKVLRNFVVNSIQHGYDNQNEKNILFILGTTEDGLRIQVDLINDGKPFEEGFTFNDFVSFGKKGGKKKGSGIGGYIMNKIVKYHNGVLEMVISDKEKEDNGNIILKTGVH